MDVGRIFDDAELLSNGEHIGGDGKLSMYMYKDDAVLKRLEFTMSPLLTVLVRRLFRLFQSLAYKNHSNRGTTPRDEENIDKLKNWTATVKLMKEAATNTKWTEMEDKTEIDNYPRKKEIDPLDRVGLAHVRGITICTGDFTIGDYIAAGAENIAPESIAGKNRASKRGRGEDETAGSSSKRSRSEEHTSELQSLV